MVHNLELFDENALYGFHIAERQGGVLQQTISYLGVDNFVDELADALLRMLLEAARSGFYRVGHHDDGSLFRERVRARIGEKRFVHLAVRILVLVGIVEVLRLARPWCVRMKSMISLGSPAFSAILTPSVTWLMTR